MRARPIAVSLAICTIWVATLFIAIFAPELKSTGVAGDTTTLPVAGIVTAAVAFIATVVIASTGFGGRGRDVDPELERAERERLEARIRDLEAKATTHNETPQAKGRLLLHR